MTNKNIARISPLIFICILLFAGSCKKSSRIEITPEETVTDIDGNVYQTVKIGSQVWMVGNLKTTRYSNGDPIPEITDDYSWSIQTQGACCDHNNDPEFSAVYGKLYNRFAVTDDRNIAPEGWHVATDTEWSILINYLGGEKVAGGKLKEEGTTHWPAPNKGATDIAGFTALPGGYRDGFGNFNTLAGGYWWSSTLYDPSDNQSGAWSRSMGYLSEAVNRYDAVPTYGQSVRCVKDH